MEITYAVFALAGTALQYFNTYQTREEAQRAINDVRGGMFVIMEVYNVNIR